MVRHRYSYCRALWKNLNRTSKPIQYDKDKDDGSKALQEMEVVLGPIK